VLRRTVKEEDDGSFERPTSLPSRDAGLATLQPVASGGDVSADDGGFPLAGLSRRDGFAPLPGRGGERDIRSRLGPPVERPPRVIPLTRVGDPPAAEIPPSSPQVDSPSPRLHFQSLAAAAVRNMPAASAADEASSSSWEGHVELDDAAGELPCDLQNVPQWARLPLQYGHISEAMRARFLEGTAAVPSVAQQLFERYDPGCTLEEFRIRLEYMVVQRGDVCAYLRSWLSGRLAQPQLDVCSILHELTHMLKYYGKV